MDNKFFPNYSHPFRAGEEVGVDVDFTVYEEGDPAQGMIFTVALNEITIDGEPVDLNTLPSDWLDTLEADILEALDYER